MAPWISRRDFLSRGALVLAGSLVDNRHKPQGHPFHQHTNPAMVLDVRGRNAEEVALYKYMPA